MTSTRMTADPAPARPDDHGGSRARPLGLGAVHVGDGFWAARQRANRGAIAHGYDRLVDAGNLDNLAVAAGRRAADAYRGPVFMDSDVYKWLEAVAWECARVPSDELRTQFDEVAELVADAQQPDGYLNSFVQATGGQRYADLAFGHELYCYGHLFQAAVAARRAFGDERLWAVAIAAADHVVATFGDGGNPGVPGHPLVEMALVELARESGTRTYAEMARTIIARRGQNSLSAHGRKSSYFSDRVPVRESITVEGHAVRAMYLAAGATDVVLDGLDDAEGGYLAALRAQWDHMVTAKMYLTGGLGSRWDGEAFGDPHELPPDVAYCETCAAIGSVQWSWRMLLATNEVQYADLIERTLYNGVLAGVSQSGDEYFYVNALQLRSDASSDDHRHPANGRLGWFDVACCPPNIMRTVASIAGYLATESDAGLQLHQYTAGTIAARGGELQLRVATAYPWNGTIEIEVEHAGDTELELALRIPDWCLGATVALNGEAAPAEPGYWRSSRSWRTGDRVVVELPMPVRFTTGHSRVDAVRGCVAIERGPLVYCVEQVDLADMAVDDIELRAVYEARWRPDLLGGVQVVDLDVPLPVVAIPYCAWANRGAQPMRVWLPAQSFLAESRA
jgi:DUF1680 family protein